jgi:hypothetical protein
MKKILAAVCAIALSATLLAGTAFAAGAGSTAVIDSTNQTELLPVDVVASANRLEILKIYELSPSVDPSKLPRDSFERAGYLYECVDILREVVIGEEYKTVTVSETAESAKNDTETVLGVLPQYKDYTDEDEFAGRLLLDTTTIKSEVSGYGSSSKEYTVSRSYPNLSDADTQYIPKTIDDGGTTLQLQDVQWQTDNTMNVDDYEIGDRYTALATYVGTKTSSYVKGYTITADYTGEVSRKGVTVIRYTVVFTGSEIPAPEPTHSPTPTPETDPAPDAGSEINQSGGGNWLPIMLSVLSLLGSGACVYLILTKRKETPRYEKNADYDYPDTYADDTGGDPGDGGGDV